MRISKHLLPVAIKVRKLEREKKDAELPEAAYIHRCNTFTAESGINHRNDR